MTQEPGGEDSPAGTILVADDVAEIRQYLQKLLTRAGYKVIMAANGVEALQQIEGAPVAIRRVLAAGGR